MITLLILVLLVLFTMLFISTYRPDVAVELEIWIKRQEWLIEKFLKK